MPVKLLKFDDKQWQHELSITNEFYENIIDIVLKINAFINDVLDVPVQPYNVNEEQINNGYNNYQRTKDDNNNYYYHQQRRYEYNGHNGVFKQVMFIPSNYVAHIVGKVYDLEIYDIYN
ncbi:unnamed protein product [Rotaria sp. Silwood1]|nr:unnamed protein product [Rotaria sp. Silwood1]CAF1458525.1 unnamed protein product [Rotaria sp. Silwood1]